MTPTAQRFLEKRLERIAEYLDDLSIGEVTPGFALNGIAHQVNEFLAARRTAVDVCEVCGCPLPCGCSFESRQGDR